MRNSGVQSAWSYTVQRLIETPGLTYQQVSEGRPDHLTPATLQVMCNKLYRMGVLDREKVRRVGKHGSPVPKYSIKDLDKIPSTWREQGADHTSQRGVKKAHGEHALKDNVAVGFAKIAKADPSERAPLETPRVYNAVEGTRRAEIVGGKWVSVPAKAQKEIRSPNMEALAKEFEKEVVQPLPETPPASGPKIVLNFPSGPKTLSLSTAKSLYFQLKEVFE